MGTHQGKKGKKWGYNGALKYCVNKLKTYPKQNVKTE